MLFEIKHYITGSVLFSGEAEDLKLAVERISDDLQGLRNAKIRDDFPAIKTPIQITGLRWNVTIWDHYMRIGCEFHSHDEWRSFDDDAIARMDGTAARQFCDAHKTALLALCAFHAEQAEKADNVRSQP